MKPAALRFLGAFAVLGLIGASHAEDIRSGLNGRLVRLDGKNFAAFPTAPLAQDKYVALYFSAGWCPPCHAFTPELVRFYNEMKPKHPGFEVVYIPQDYSENDMKSYMEEMSMPWPAMRYDYAKSDRQLGKYCGPGIPSLVVFNEKGEVVSTSWDGKQYLGAYKVLKDLGNLLEAEPASSTSSASKPATAPSSQASVKSPSDTNWDEAFKKKP
jgi:nucleoredoxin